MNRIALIAISSSLATVVQAAEPTGLWATPANGGRVQISRCGDSLCGKLAGSNDLKVDPAFRDINNRDPALRGRALMGLPMLWGFTGGPERWSGGRVYNPQDGGIYSGSIELLSADTLKLKGCIVAPLCRSQVWVRVK